jgi:translation initiation factor IF-1
VFEKWLIVPRTRFGAEGKTGRRESPTRLSPGLEKRMSAEQPIELEGTIATVLPGTMFRVKLDNQHEVLAHLSGKMRKNFVRLTVGDRVRLEMSPYDLTKARITYRLK